MDKNQLDELVWEAGAAARDAAYAVISAAFDDTAFPEGVAVRFDTGVQMAVEERARKLIAAKLAHDGVVPSRLPHVDGV